jgi:hypothetical protein
VGLVAETGSLVEEVGEVVEGGWRCTFVGLVDRRVLRPKAVIVGVGVISGADEAIKVKEPAGVGRVNNFLGSGGREVFVTGRTGEVETIPSFLVTTPHGFVPIFLFFRSRHFLRRSERTG